MIEACIFDLDGTIINTVESLRYSASETLKTFGYPELSEEQTKAFVGNGGRNFIMRALKLNGNESEEDLEKAVAIYKEIFKANCTVGNTAYSGMKGTLHELKGQGMKLAVISNKSQERVEDCISKVYGDDLFDIVWGEREGIPLKPDPTGLMMLADELGVAIDDCMYIGDGDTDMQAGMAAGCVTVGVSWGYRPAEKLKRYDPQFMISRPVDLLTVIKYYV